MRAKIQQWIDDNFTGQLVQEDWPILPGGTIVSDTEGGELFCWWNFLEEKVECKIAD